MASGSRLVLRGPAGLGVQGLVLGHEDAALGHEPDPPLAALAQLDRGQAGAESDGGPRLDQPALEQAEPLQIDPADPGVLPRAEGAIVEVKADPLDLPDR